MKIHISLRVRDLARSVAFYQAFLGAAPHKLRPGYANFDLTEPPLKLALNETPISAGTGPLDHLGFQVSTLAEVHRAKERLQAAGLATFDESDVTCCYAKQDKIWAHDPDGNEWEIYVLTDDREDETVSAAVMTSTFRALGKGLTMVSEAGAACCGGSADEAPMPAANPQPAS